MTESTKTRVPGDNRPVIPLMDRTFDQWWMHGLKGTYLYDKHLFRLNSTQVLMNGPVYLQTSRLIPRTSCSSQSERLRRSRSTVTKAEPLSGVPLPARPIHRRKARKTILAQDIQCHNIVRSECSLSQLIEISLLTKYLLYTFLSLPL